MKRAGITEKKIAIIGAGIMGSGIANKYAIHGFSVSIIDQHQEALEKSRKSIDAAMKQGIARGIFGEPEARDIVERLRFGESLDQCADAGLIVEAIFEDRSKKRDLFLAVESLCHPDAVLATNTSSFRVADIGCDLRYRHRVVGLHYFYPPAKNRLVELIGTSLSDADSLARARWYQEQIKKIVITSKDSPGFVVNRFFVPWLNESMRIVDEGIANIATVETAAKEFFGIGMGPFELMNITGLPITLHASTSLSHSFGHFYAPCKMLMEQIKREATFDLTGGIDRPRLFEISMRLFAVIAAVSYQMVYEENVCTSADADLGARIGLLWPKGPFELIDCHGNSLPLALKNTSQANSAFCPPQALIGGPVR